MKRVKRFIGGLAVSIAAVAYLNMGYVVAKAYEHASVRYRCCGDTLGLHEKALIADGLFVYKNAEKRFTVDESGKTHIDIVSFVAINILWPFLVSIVVAFWVIYGAYWLFSHALYYAAMGGIAKLLGLA